MKTSIDLGYIQMSSYKPTTALTPDYLDDAAPVDPNEIVLKKGDYTLVIDYPLGHPYAAKVKVTKGMTRRQLVSRIIMAYREIYEEPEVYGIWGHCLGDLILHTAEVEGRRIGVGCDS